MKSPYKEDTTFPKMQVMFTEDLKKWKFYSIGGKHSYLLQKICKIQQ